MSQRIAVIGPGAIGGITAALMAEKGHDVTLVCKHKEIAEKAGGQGIHLTGVRGERMIPVKSVCQIEELTGLYDFCLIATKAYDMPDSAKRMLPFLREDSLVVSMQNGICTDKMAQVVGEKRTVGCVVGFGATMKGPAELEMTSTGEFVIGLMDGSTTNALSALQTYLSSVVPTVISTNIYAELYSKLIVNSCITSLGAVCGLRLGEMMKRKNARNIFLAIIGEAVNVADAMKLTIPPYGGKLNYHTLMKGTSPLDNLRRHTMIRIVGMKYKNLKSSSLQSLERGRPTEIDYFNGYIAQKGKSLRVPCPVNEQMTRMVKEIEQGKRKIELKNLDEVKC